MTSVFHPTYYLKDGVVFVVQDIIFKIPRYLLESSSAFFTQLLTDVPSNNETKPVKLENITAAEFEHLLMFLYPLTPPSTSMSVALLDISQWISILRLATLYDMPTIRALGMQLLSTHVHDPLMKISLGRSYEYTPWIKEGFATLCLRKEPLSVDEGQTLSKEDVIRLAAAREEIRKRVGNIRLDDATVEKKMIKAREDTTNESPFLANYDSLFQNRPLHRIINNAFHFSPDSTDMDTNMDTDTSPLPSKTAPFRFPWPSLNLNEFPTPRIFWLVKSHSDISRMRQKTDKFGTSDIDVGKEIASVITVDDFVESHSLKDKLKGLDLVKNIQASASALNLKVIVAVSVVAGVMSVIGSSVVG